MFPPPRGFVAVILLFFLWMGVLPLHAQVVINEIHYKPSDPTKLLEFIELHNPGAEAVNVGLWRLEDAVECLLPQGLSIPAGGYVVVAGNAAAFQTQFGFAPNAVCARATIRAVSRVKETAQQTQVVFWRHRPW